MIAKNLQSGNIHAFVVTGKRDSLWCSTFYDKIYLDLCKIQIKAQRRIREQAENLR